MLPAAHPVTDVAVAPLFLLVPVGWGLAYLSVCGHRWRMPEFSLPYLYLSAFLFGVVARTLVYQVFERSGWLQTLYGIMFPLDLFLSWWGWIRWRESMSFRPRSPQEWWLVGGLLSLVLVLYSFYYLKFTQFPLRDIFQETHFMKGAVELARFHILNPYTADSYIPMLQVQLGMLHGWYGFDLLISQWLLPPLNAAIRIAALYCFWRTVAPGVYSRMIALGLSMIALQNLFSPTNGDLLFSLCLLFMSLVIMDGRRTGGGVRFELRLLGVLAGCALLYRATAVWNFGYAVLPLYVLVAWLLRRGVPDPSVTVLALLAVVGVTLHPAMSLLYLTTSLGVALLYLRLVGTQSGQELRGGRIWVAAAGILTVLLTALLLSLLPELFAGQKPSARFLGIAEWLLGKSITGAEGSRNAAIEWVRLAPPIVHLVGTVLLGAAAVRRVPMVARLKSGAVPTSVQDSAFQPILLFAWLILMLILFPSLSGFPYFHRVLYFGVLMVCLIVGVLAESELQAFLRGGGRRGVYMATGALVGGFFIIMTLVYGVPDFAGHGRSPYLRRLSPFLLIAFGGTFAAWVAAMVTRSRAHTVRLLIGSLLLAVLTDKTAIVTYGFQYAYGGTYPEGRPISHYTAEEVSLAQRLNARTGRTLLLSDPYTLSIMQALTGLNGLVTFSNLGVMEPWYRDRLRTVLSCLYRPSLRLNCDGPSQFVVQTEEFLRQFPGAWPEARYARERRGEPFLDHQAIHDDVVVVLNRRRTLSWIQGRDGYFPDFDAGEDWELDGGVQNILLPADSEGNDLAAYTFR
ncbi:MAG: hypothetical protein KF814_14690 [Nitrospiraceae bacterium]|nr:hypothetical protein [Nitrospiraceae bacterium]